MKPAQWLLLAFLACGINVLYMARVLLPWEYYFDVEGGRLKAEMGDLYPRWVGTRELLLHRKNPYGPEVSHEIQMAFYGHAIEQNYEAPPANIVDEQRFVYPVYVVFLLAPTVYMDFSSLQQVAPALLALLTGFSVLLWLRVLRWRPPKMLAAATALLVLSSPQIMQGLRLRQLGFAVAFLLALGTWFVARNRLVLAGILFAASTIKPQMVVVPIAWFLFWGMSDWRRRWLLPTSFLITLTVLVGLGEFILPGWPRDFLAGLIAYRHYFPTTSLVRLAAGDFVGGAISIVGMGAMCVLGWRNRGCEATSAAFLRTLSSSFFVAALVLPLLTPYNQVLLMLPALAVFRGWDGLPLTLRRTFALTLAWPYLCSAVFLLHPPSLTSTRRYPLLPSCLELFVPFFLVILFAMVENRGNNQDPVSSIPASSPLPA